LEGSVVARAVLRVDSCLGDVDGVAMGEICCRPTFSEEGVVSVDEEVDAFGTWRLVPFFEK